MSDDFFDKLKTAGGIDFVKAANIEAQKREEIERLKWEIDYKKNLYKVHQQNKEDPRPIPPTKKDFDPKHLQEMFEIYKNGGMSPQQFRDLYEGTFSSSDAADAFSYSAAAFKNHTPKIHTKKSIEDDTLLIRIEGEIDEKQLRDIAKNVATENPEYKHYEILFVDDTGKRYELEELISQRREDMANKFLPFVVENSTPLHIFKTLLSRSKGMNSTLVASVFYMTLEVDIKKLREKVKELPEMSLERLYEELLTQHEKYRIEDFELARVVQMGGYIKPDEKSWNSELDELSREDIMMFFYVLGKHGAEFDQYNKPDFPEVDWNTVLTDMHALVANIPAYVSLKDDGEKVVISSKEELQGFLMYAGLYLKQIAKKPGTYAIEFAK